MRIPIIAGQPLYFWLGILLFLLVLFQIAAAKKMFHIPFRCHRINGYVILAVAIIHGSLALGLYLGFFRL